MKPGRSLVQNFAHALGNCFDFSRHNVTHGTDDEQTLRSIQVNRIHGWSSHEADVLASVGKRFECRAVRWKPLERVLEESVFEGWLKRARLSVADPK